MRQYRVGLGALGIVSALTLCAGTATAAGTLTPVSASTAPMEIREHHVNVVLDNGFSKTEVDQTFFNPNSVPVDAVYEFPVPKDAALSEMEIDLGDKKLRGEVTAKEQAQAIYDQQKQSGATAGLATKNGYQTFQFDVSQIPPGKEARMTFVYYEPASIDTSVGRYLYPLQDGGTRDEAASSFWTRNEQVTTAFSFDLELKSAAPIADVRLPGYEGATTEQLGEGHYKLHLDSATATLNQDIVCYYRLRDDLPGRVEVVPYRREAGGAGTFMMILTPGIDLAPITAGRDFVYVLDVSGSMDTKLHTLTMAVAEALTQLKPEDRFRIITFSDGVQNVTKGFLAANAENIGTATAAVEALVTQGGTNLYAGLTTSLDGLTEDRVTGVVLVTDGVTNEGVVDPVKFDTLLRERDARVFGLLMGNNANWPLMEIITQASGGFYAGVSNQDDILGQIMLADGKISHESLHDAKLSLSGAAGARVHDTTNFDFGKVYHGQQLVVFGRYDEAGSADLALATKISGKPRTYSTTFSFPDANEDNPELERLWALQMIHGIEHRKLLGLVPATEAAASIRDLGVQYQLVTDETSMLVVDDSVFTDNGIDRNNVQRSADEHAAQVRRDAQPATDYTVGQGQPPFGGGTAPSVGVSAPPSSGSSGSTGSSGSYDSGSSSGGGALDPFTAGAGILLALYRLRRGYSRGRTSTAP
jgi:Ca-activated chloride channel family protein